MLSRNLSASPRIFQHVCKHTRWQMLSWDNLNWPSCIMGYQPYVTAQVGQLPSALTGWAVQTSLSLSYTRWMSLTLQRFINDQSVAGKEPVSWCSRLYIEVDGREVSVFSVSTNRRILVSSICTLLMLVSLKLVLAHEKLAVRWGRGMLECKGVWFPQCKSP